MDVPRSKRGERYVRREHEKQNAEGMERQTIDVEEREDNPEEHVESDEGSLVSVELGDEERAEEHILPAQEPENEPGDGSGMIRMFELLKQMKEEGERRAEEAKEQIKQIDEKNERRAKQIDEKNERRAEDTKEEIKRMAKNVTQDLSKKLEAVEERIMAKTQVSIEALSERITENTRSITEHVDRLDKDIEQNASKWKEALKLSQERTGQGLAEIHGELEKHTQQVNEVRSEVEQQAGRVTECQTLINDRHKSNQQELDKLRLEMETDRSQTTVRTEIIGDSRVSDDRKFRGHSSRAIRFLTDIRQELGSKINNWQRSQHIIRHFLTGTALEWYETYSDQLKSFDEFEAQFKRRFWSSVIQNNLRRELEVGVFNPNGRMNPVEYLTSKYKIARQLDSQINEEQFVITISRHFDGFVQDARMCGAIKTIDQLQDLLDARHAHVMRFNRDDRRRNGYEGGRQHQGNAYQNRDNRPPRPEPKWQDRVNAPRVTTSNPKN
jgi:DNA repair exonuclease SbcCD ATPase subunit